MGSTDFMVYLPCLGCPPVGRNRVRLAGGREKGVAARRIGGKAARWRLRRRRGEFTPKELTFFIVREFPTPESEIKMKDLWPFSKAEPLLFRLTTGRERYLITSIEQ